MESRYTFTNNYRDNHILRESFNDMAERTFCINFEPWYKKGYWTENFNPYSIVDDNKIISNVSVNTLDFIYSGEVKHYIQIGTVMTDDKYRNQGLSRYLIEKIIEEYKERTDGIFLFANDSVLDFYPKFGFEKVEQYEYYKSVNISAEQTAVLVDMNDEENVSEFIKAAEGSKCNALLEMNNIQIIMFYITLYMKECVYYIPKSNAYVIAEIENKQLYIYEIYSEVHADIDEIIKSFGKGINKVILGFTPLDTQNYEAAKIDKGDTLFVLGKDLEIFQYDRIMFPILSHT